MDLNTGQEVVTDENGELTVAEEESSENKTEKALPAIATPVKQAVVKIAKEAEGKLTTAIKQVEGAPEADEKSNSLPKEVSGLFAAIANTLNSIGEKFPGETSKAIELPKPVAEAVKRIAVEAQERLMSVVNALKDAKTTEDQTPTPLPKNLAAEINSIVALLSSIGEKYPTPKSKADENAEAEGEKKPVETEEKPDGEEGAGDEGEKKEEGDGEEVTKSTVSLDELKSDLISGLKDALLKEVGSTLKSQVDPLKKELKKQGDRLVKLEKAEGMPNSELPEGIRGEPAEISWPPDMNDARFDRSAVGKNDPHFWED